MIEQETIERIVAYVNGLKDPAIDPETVRNGVSIFFSHREIERQIENFVFKRYGISWRQMETLTALFHKQDKQIMPAQLADEVNLTRSAMTSNLDSLERKEYLSRSAHPEDRRKIVITLTKKGLEFCNKIMPMRYRDMSLMVERLSLEAIETMKTTYDVLTEYLQELGEEKVG